MFTNDYIDKLVNVYLDGITSLSNDSGWRGDSVMARFAEYAGEAPRGSGNDTSNTAMINHIRNLEDEHPDFKKISFIVKTLLNNPYSSHAVIALVAKHYYRGVYTIEVDSRLVEIPWDDETRGKQIGQDLPTFRFNVKAGRRFIRNNL